MSESLVEVVRGPVTEAIHRGDLAVVSADGRLRASVGDPVGKMTYWRSAAKPFQALSVVSSGAAERWRLGAEDLALIAASHNGEPVHVERAASLLERIGGRVHELACGAHPPLDPAAAATLARNGERPSPLHNNCSGKHIGMLALARHVNADLAGYYLPDHPVQRTIIETVARFAGLDAEDIAIGVDGCGVPCFATTVYHLALAFARLADPEGLPPGDARAARRLAAAMVGSPYLVAGRGRFDTDVMEVARGSLVAKGGASGVQCVASRGGIGLAVKIEDGALGTGSIRPAALTAIAALRQLDLLDDSQVASLGAHARPAVETIAGQSVGEARAVFELVLATERSA